MAKRHAASWNIKVRLLLCNIAPFVRESGCIVRRPLRILGTIIQKEFSAVHNGKML